jgi:hypothetical protein
LTLVQWKREFEVEVSLPLSCPKVRGRGSSGPTVVEVEKPAEARATSELPVCPLPFVGPTFLMSWPPTPWCKSASHRAIRIISCGIMAGESMLLAVAGVTTATVFEAGVLYIGARRPRSKGRGRLAIYRRH